VAMRTCFLSSAEITSSRPEQKILRLPPAARGRLLAVARQKGAAPSQDRGCHLSTSEFVLVQTIHALLEWHILHLLYLSQNSQMSGQELIQTNCSRSIGCPLEQMGTFQLVHKASRSCFAAKWTQESEAAGLQIPGVVVPVL